MFSVQVKLSIMAQPEVKKNSRNSILTIIRQYLGLRSTIYGRVVMIITLAVVILFVIFLALFRTVFANYFNIVLKQSGNNVERRTIPPKHY
jgi:hypothetical protein